MSYKDNSKKINTKEQPYYGLSVSSALASFKEQMKQTGWGLTRHNPILLEENLSKYGGWAYEYYVIKDDNRLYRKLTKDSDEEVCLGYVGPQARLYAIKQTPHAWVDDKIQFTKLNVNHDGKIQLTKNDHKTTPKISIA